MGTITAYLRRDNVDFAAVNRAALTYLPSLVRTWCAYGKMSGHEWIAINPTSGRPKPGSFSINTKTGRWADFATGDAGGDPVSLGGLHLRYAPGRSRAHPGSSAGAAAVTITYTYNDANGDYLGTITRNVDSSGEKTFRASRGFPSPRPLYGLIALPNGPPIQSSSVEGEKTADAASKIFPDYVCVTSPFGAKSAAKADWTPLSGARRDYLAG